MNVKENIFFLRQEIKALCQKINKDPSEIIVLAVTKGAEIGLIKEAIGEGVVDIGENKVQEALIKYNQLITYNSGLITLNPKFALEMKDRRDAQHKKMPYKFCRRADFAIAKSGLKWHMIGHLQANKAKDAVKIFDLIHSVDSLRLAEEINKQAEEINKRQDVLLEVNVSGEKTKFGLKPEELIDVINKAMGLKNINIKGLMTMAPLSDNPESVRPCFCLLRELRDKVISKFGFRISDFGFLSMGMSMDYRVAIEEGATIIRIGSAIFKK